MLLWDHLVGVFVVIPNVLLWHISGHTKCNIMTQEIHFTMRINHFTVNIEDEKNNCMLVTKFRVGILPFGDNDDDGLVTKGLKLEFLSQRWDTGTVIQKRGWKSSLSEDEEEDDELGFYVMRIIFSGIETLPNQNISFKRFLFQSSWLPSIWAMNPKVLCRQAGSWLRLLHERDSPINARSHPLLIE